MLYCYTAIFGRVSDSLRPLPAARGVKFVAFVDRRHNFEEGWELRPPQREYEDKRRQARWHKCRAHELFPDAEHSLWIDGNLLLKGSPARLLPCLDACDLATFRHQERRCVYDELFACIRHRKDSEQIMVRQVDRYAALGYPRDNGLAETCAVLRRHTDAVNRFNEAWWREIENGSVRDQLSFDYVAWRLHLSYACFPGRVGSNEYFRKYYHRYVRYGSHQ